MSTPWESYLADVLPDVPGCPEEAAILAIRNAAIDFCTRTQLWRETLAAVNVVATQSDYPLTPSLNTTKIVTVLSATLSNIPLNGPLSDDELDQLGYEWRDQTSDTPDSFALSAPDTIRLIYTPTVNINAALVARVALKPTQTATDAADFLFNDWHEGIGHGAKARLKATPNKPWSHPDMVDFHERKFRAAISNGKAKALKGNSNKTITAFPQKLGR